MSGAAFRVRLDELSQQNQGRNGRCCFEVMIRLLRNAASAEEGKAPGATTATELYTYAAPTPTAISVNMLRLRLTIDCHARVKKKPPAQRTTGVVSTNSIHFPSRFFGMIE